MISEAEVWFNPSPPVNASYAINPGLLHKRICADQTSLAQSISSESVPC